DCRQGLLGGLAVHVLFRPEALHQADEARRAGAVGEEVGQARPQRDRLLHLQAAGVHVGRLALRLDRRQRERQPPLGLHVLIVLEALPRRRPAETFRQPARQRRLRAGLLLQEGGGDLFTGLPLGGRVELRPGRGGGDVRRVAL